MSSVSLESIPRFTISEALAVAAQEYGIRGSATCLPSERDQNFLIAAAGGRRFVLKFANSMDARELLDFQNQAMALVADPGVQCRVQSVLANRSGVPIAAARDPRNGREHWVRMLTWIDGAVLADCASGGPELFESIGASLARIDAALGHFVHPAMHRVLQWDVRHAGLARQHSALLPAARRARIERHFSRWEQVEWAGLRHGVIHGDANDHNVIVADGRMSGLLDFGDMVHTATICDLAIALAYTLLGRSDPPAIARQIIHAYERVRPLTGAERRALLPLILARLSMSVCYSAHNRLRNPADPYQVVSEDAAWALLERLEPYADADPFGILAQ